MSKVGHLPQQQRLPFSFLWSRHLSACHMSASLRILTKRRNLNLSASSHILMKCRNWNLKKIRTRRLERWLIRSFWIGRSTMRPPTWRRPIFLRSSRNSKLGKLWWVRLSLRAETDSSESRKLRRGENLLQNVCSRYCSAFCEMARATVGPLCLARCRASIWSAVGIDIAQMDRWITITTLR